MEDTKPNDNTEITGTENLNNQDPSSKDNDSRTEPLDTRRIILWGLGGAYLCYVGYQLCTGYLKGDAESHIAFFLGGIVFFCTGILLLFKVLKNYSAAEKEKKERIQKGEPLPQDLPFGGLFMPKEEISQQKQHKLSISERARLASTIEEIQNEELVEEPWNTPGEEPDIAPDEKPDIALGEEPDIAPGKEPDKEDEE